MEEFYSRTAMLLGEEAIKKLAEARVAVFGIGGVGGYVVEALVRAGVGAIDLIDISAFICRKHPNSLISHSIPMWWMLLIQ